MGPIGRVTHASSATAFAGFSSDAIDGSPTAASKTAFSYGRSSRPLS